MGLVTNWYVLLLLRGTAGIGLAAILPIIHHLVSDAFVPAKRGGIFGLLGACQMLGGIVSIVFATNMSASTGLILGLAGWRCTFIVTGLFGLGVGAVAFVGLSKSELLRNLGGKGRHQTQAQVVELLTQREQRYDRHQQMAVAAPSTASTAAASTSVFSNTIELFANRTFLLIFLRSALDGIPMNANSLMLLWFEYMGFAESHASGLIALLLFCNGISSLFFGWLGDYMHVRRPAYGRLSVALSALLLQITFTCLLFVGVQIEDQEENPEGNPAALDQIMVSGNSEGETVVNDGVSYNPRDSGIEHTTNAVLSCFFLFNSPDELLSSVCGDYYWVGIVWRCRSTVLRSTDAG